MVASKSFIYKKAPEGYPVPGQDVVVESREVDIETPPADGIITKNKVFSFDPYQRGRMQPEGAKSYMPPYKFDSVIANHGVAEVIKSDDPKFAVGDLVVGPMPIQEYSRLSEKWLKNLKKLENKHNLPLTNFVGVLGMPGLTSYSSLYKIGKPKKGETIFVSAAAGAVGALVGQLAKREGLRVIGSAGSDEKVNFVKEKLGFDDAFNYKTKDPHQALAEQAPNGIDIYFDNVGGVQLDAAMEHANDFARFIECGMISYYNAKNPQDIHLPRNIFMTVAKRLTIQGFIVSDPGFADVYGKEHFENVSKWLASGEIIAQEDIAEGIDNAPEAFVGMLQGKNFGKAALRV